MGASAGRAGTAASGAGAAGFCWALFDAASPGRCSALGMTEYRGTKLSAQGVAPTDPPLAVALSSFWLPLLSQGELGVAGGFLLASTSSRLDQHTPCWSLEFLHLPGRVLGAVQAVFLLRSLGRHPAPARSEPAAHRGLRASSCSGRPQPTPPCRGAGRRWLEAAPAWPCVRRLLRLSCSASSEPPALGRPSLGPSGESECLGQGRLAAASLRFTPAAAAGGRTGEHLTSSHLWVCLELLAALLSRFQAAACVLQGSGSTAQGWAGPALPLRPAAWRGPSRGLSGSGPFPLPARTCCCPLHAGLARPPAPLPSFRGLSQPIFRSRAGTEWSGAREVTFPTSCVASSVLSPDSCQNGWAWPSPGGCRATTGPLETQEPAACWQEPRKSGLARPRMAGSSCCGRRTGTQRTRQARSQVRGA